MNERIRKLIRNLDNELGRYFWTGEEKEKFAELIVRECMAQCLKVEEDDESGVSVDALLCREEIRKHFGVE